MGRHFEVRAASMQKTAKKKSALYARASKEIYVAAKQGEKDPNMNLPLRSTIEKYRSQGVPKDIIERAINKAHGIGQEDVQYIEGRYEAMGNEGWMLIIDTLSDNVTRAYTFIRSTVNKNNGQMATVNYAFSETGVFVFEGSDYVRVEEALILNDIDLWDTSYNETQIQVQVNPSDFGKTRDKLIEEFDIKQFAMAEIRMIAHDKIIISKAEEENLQILIDKLEELEDVQAIYHNVEFSE